MGAGGLHGGWVRYTYMYNYTHGHFRLCIHKAAYVKPHMRPPIGPDDDYP